MANVDPGLCARCGWARAVTSVRGSRFLRCGRSDIDAAYARYPRLPVQACAGFDPAPAEAPRTDEARTEAAP